MSNSVDVVLIRHAQSTWNVQGRFTGWSDPALTPQGISEANVATNIIRERGIKFDHAYSSRLQRADHTARIILQGLRAFDIKVRQDWRLNERHYGDLQGKSKKEVMANVGEQQVWRWCQGYNELGNPMLKNNPAHPKNNPRYGDIPAEQLPDVESLADTTKRVLAFWNEIAVPHIQANQSILISTHSNTLRGLIKELSGMSIDEVESFEIPTGAPILYKFQTDGTPITWEYLKGKNSVAA